MVSHRYRPSRQPEWETFITGGNDGQGDGEPQIPTVSTTAEKKALLSYLGCPPIAGLSVNAMALMATNKIFNERYRDQDLVPERGLTDNSIMRIAWEKDQFSTARPWTQRGPDVSIPIGENLKVFANTNADNTPIEVDDLQGQPRVLDTDATPPGAPLQLGATGGSGAGLYADAANATGANINDVRAAFAIQRYQEARARYGARYVEYLRYLGINPSDARLQDPEYLGGGRQRLQFSEVLQTANDTDTSTGPRTNIGVGDMYGHGIAGARTNKFRKFFEEHGYIITLMSIRPKAIYQNGLHREWFKTTKEDFFQKELANLGQQEVATAELFGQDPGTVFGYQDRYYEYRRHPSQVHNDFRDTLNAYHMARELDASVALNQSFVECNPSDRIFQIGEQVADTCWIMANHHVVARRLVPKHANPKVI